MNPHPAWMIAAGLISVTAAIFGGSWLGSRGGRPASSTDAIPAAGAQVGF
jgi:hypothetical protein